MKKLFYIGLACITLFEILNVYFIMPMPGSQRMDSIDIAYALYRYRWFFRIFFLLMMAVGAAPAFQIRHKWIPLIACIPALVVGYFFNFKMTADKMFLQPRSLLFKGPIDNKLNDSTVVVAVENNGIVRGYPVRFIVYHHQVRDTLGGAPIMVTYCSVCRTGRVFEPVVGGKTENFRLVGMDHFNAMFEDATTKSWWRQATGEAITGPLKGSSLPEMESQQLTAHAFFSLYPGGQIMQPEDVSKPEYDSMGRYEKGRSKGSLTRTDTASWKDKSWVVGVQIGKDSKAYDWNLLRKKTVLHDSIGNQPIVLVLSRDGQSFGAFERPADKFFFMRHDTIFNGRIPFNFAGEELQPPFGHLKKVNAYQEFWHSWRTFHPETIAYPSKEI